MHNEITHSHISPSHVFVLLRMIKYISEQQGAVLFLFFLISSILQWAFTSALGPYGSHGYCAKPQCCISFFFDQS